MSELHHAKTGHFGFGEEPKWPEDYRLVARVDSDDLETIFDLTNHIDHPWQQNPEVVAIIDQNPRPTSAGDVVIKSDGTIWQYELVGYKKLGPPHVCPNCSYGYNPEIGCPCQKKTLEYRGCTIVSETHEDRVLALSGKSIKRYLKRVLRITLPDRTIVRVANMRLARIYIDGHLGEAVGGIQNQR